jgi:hypothetical protein
MDLDVFEEGVGVDLRGDLGALSASEEFAVRAFARDAAEALEAAVLDTEGVDAQVTCLYRLDDPTRVDLLTLGQACAVPRRAQAARRLSDGGLGVLLSLASPVEVVTVDAVTILSDGVTATASVSIVVVKETPEPPPSEPPAPPPESGGALGIAAAGVFFGAAL